MKIVRESLNEGILDKFKKKPQPEKEPNLPVEDFGGEKPEKSKPNEGYDLDRFYATLNVLGERGQKERQQHLVDIFFRNFIGKPLFDSKIKEINADVLVDHDYYGLSIKTQDGSKANYVFSQGGNTDSVNGIKLAQHRNKPLTPVTVSRKDARTIGLIAKKFNPNTKYAKGTGDLTIKEY